MSENKKDSFEARVQRLEKLVRQCASYLDGAEQKITELLKVKGE